MRKILIRRKSDGRRKNHAGLQPPYLHVRCIRVFLSFWVLKSPGLKSDQCLINDRYGIAVFWDWTVHAIQEVPVFDSSKPRKASVTRGKNKILIVQGTASAQVDRAYHKPFPI